MISQDRIQKLAIMRANPHTDFIECRICGRFVVSENWNSCPDCEYIISKIKFHKEEENEFK